MVTAGARFFITDRIAIGPEIINDITFDDWTVLVNGSINLRRSAALMPYLTFGGGVLMERHWRARTEPALAAGFGVRMPIGRHLFVAPEFRLIAVHPVFGVVVGWRP
jgi:hypothetical protein